MKESGDQPLLETVTEYAPQSTALLILDNFEQVLAAAPQIAELLASVHS